MGIICLVLFPAVGVLESGAEMGWKIVVVLTCDVDPLLFIGDKGPIVQNKYVLSGGQKLAIHTIMK